MQLCSLSSDILVTTETEELPVVEFNKQQVTSFLAIGLAVGGPVGAVILKLTGLTPADYQLYVNAALFVLPPAAAVIYSWFGAKKDKLVAAVEKLPEVATVVVKDETNGKLGQMAASDNHPNVVTESQNEADAKQGTKAA